MDKRLQLSCNAAMVPQMTNLDVERWSALIAAANAQILAALISSVRDVRSIHFLTASGMMRMWPHLGSSDGVPPARKERVGFEDLDVMNEMKNEKIGLFGNMIPQTSLMRY